jgi:glucokinase
MSEPANKAELFVGVDLGGTKILAGVFDPDLNCLGRAKVSTKPERGPDEVIERIARCVRDAVDECDRDLKQVKAVGVGAPGTLDVAAGRVLFAPNLRWEDVPLKKTLEKELGLPVFVENDANAAVLGVYETELASKPRHVIGIFLGTGIGGGIILDGKLFSGVLRSSRQPHRHLPQTYRSRRRRQEDHPHRIPRPEFGRPSQRRPPQGHQERRQAGRNRH